MVDRHKVKITVLKRFSPSEVFGETSPATEIGDWGVGEACGILRDGQEFVVGEDGKMPEGFCTPAWNSIYNYVRTLAFGGNFPWFKEKGIALPCCPDGLRPVVFKLERI